MVYHTVYHPLQVYRTQWCIRDTLAMLPAADGSYLDGAQIVLVRSPLAFLADINTATVASCCAGKLHTAFSRAAACMQAGICISGRLPPLKSIVAMYHSKWALIFN